MTEQLTLFPMVKGKPKLTLKEKFEEFHENNPHVYNNLVILAKRLKNNGRQKAGMRELFEVLRWEYKINTKHEDDEFVLNNNYTPLYSRMVVKEVPGFEGFFDIRETGKLDR
jgi:hypothetical protein